MNAKYSSSPTHYPKKELSFTVPFKINISPD